MCKEKYTVNLKVVLLISFIKIFLEILPHSVLLVSFYFGSAKLYQTLIYFKNNIKQAGLVAYLL
jgi:hypothetical protein